MDRIRVENSGIIPYRYICLLEIYRIGPEGVPFAYPGRSTGFLIDKNVILTAGHSLSETASTISHLVVYPYINAPSPPPLYKIEVPPGTFKLHKMADYDNPYCYVKDDYGIIVLPSDAVYQLTGGHFEWNENYLSAESLSENAAIHLAGYPMDKPDFEMWHEEGRVVEITKHCLIHSFTTTKRNSGSPLWIEHQGRPIVVGIHVSGNAASCGYRPENREFGSAVLINKRVYDTISAWMRGEEEEAGELYDSVPGEQAELPQIPA